MMSRGSLLFLRSVGQRSRSPGHGNIKCCPDDNSRTLGPRIMKLHRELGFMVSRGSLLFFKSVGQGSRSLRLGYIKRWPDNNSRMHVPWIMKLHRELG